MEAWLAQHFVHTAFVPWGTALVAAPILIHLINRLRFRRVRFAAMEFLLQSERRNRRRVLLEQILLLLLRILIVLVIVLLIARLILDPLQLSLLRGAKSHHVVILDDSGSMRDRRSDRTAFDMGKHVIQNLIAEGKRRPGTQRFSLILLSHPGEPFCTNRDVDELFASELEMKLRNVRCTHQSVRLTEGLDAAAELLVSDTKTVKHLHVISDFRQQDWMDQKAIGASLRALHAAGTTLNLVRTVSSMHQNLAITQLAGDVQIAAAGVPLRLKVAVKNLGDQVAHNVRLLVLQDGQKLPLALLFDDIEARAEVTRAFDLTFAVPGRHHVQVTIPRDALAEDNARFLALDIAPINEVLIVYEGSSAEEAAYLADALAADPHVTGVTCRIETADYLRKSTLDRFQSVCLLNVSELPADAVAYLEQFVARGGGLAWFLGDQVRSAFYGQNLYKDGQGLFPLPLGPAPRTLPSLGTAQSGPDLQLTDHPIFSVFSGQENPYIDAARVYKYFPAADDWQRDDQKRGDRVRTIASLRNNAPLMLEHPYGAGKVITCLTTCGPTWNNWALYASYVVLQLELQKYIARTDRALPQRIVGEPIREVLDPSEFTEDVEITTPELAGQRVIRLKAAPASSGNVDEPPGETDGSKNAPPAPSQPRSEQQLRIIANYTQTDTPGIYTVRLSGHNQNDVEHWLAYNFPLSESELAVMSSRDIRQSVGSDVPLHIQESGDLTWIGGKSAGQELRDWLLALLIVLLLAEQALALRMGYHRRSGDGMQSAG